MDIPRFAWLSLLLASVAAPAYPQAPSSPPSQGKIVALNGRVEHTVAQPEQWNPARMFQPLFVTERVRTMAASRAAILFIDETQVKLNAGAVLTVREVRRTGGASTTLELSKGEGWFRTKNPQSGLRIETPAAAAAVRGTEINVRVAPDNETTLTVVEGAAEFSNPQGSIVVNAGEEGTARPGQAPTKRVILNPEDAVQWALYYPSDIAWHDLPAAARAPALQAGFDRLRAGDLAGALQIFDAAPADPWSRIGASMAHLRRGNTELAASVLSAPGQAASAEAAVERRAQLAAVSLAVGDLAAARREIDAALAENPAALRPLILLSSIDLRQNKADRAQESAERALAAHPGSVGALLAASEAAQARFDLRTARRHLDRAITLDPSDVHALVNRARIRFGTDDTRGARDDANRAAAVARDDAQVRSLLGFINLAEGNHAAARADFAAAAMADTEFGEPHLGLGLIDFRDGHVDEGLLEMLTATLLEPKVALYQSYLGKAYYQARRFPEGLAALASAKRLDPRDPTPWLYSSLYLRDQNHQVDALNDLRHAIALNDHRAVYRSRLLLDRDLATKNVSLAEIYRQLGFESWGAYEALNSLETDVTNSSAHLFLADTYNRLPDRTQASSSELLQYFLYAPVNRNSFNNFAEYTALLEQPRRQLSVVTETGSRERRYGDVVHQGGNERFADFAFLEVSQQNGARPTKDDDRLQGFFQGKLALGPRSDLFMTFSGVRSNTGASESATRVFGVETGRPVILRQFTTPDPTLTNRFTDAESTLGLKHQWRPGSALTASVRYDRLEQTDEALRSETSACSGLPLAGVATSSNSLTNPYNSLEMQVQQATRLGRHQVIAGQQIFRLDKKQLCDEIVTITQTGETLPLTTETSAHDSAEVTYVRDEVQITPSLHASIGVAYEQVSYHDLSTGKAAERNQWNPRLGASLRLTPTTVLRAAAFRNLNTNFLSSNIAPSTVSGFVVVRNEFPTAIRKEYNVSVEHSGARAFLGVRTFYRETTTPFLLASGSSFIPDADARGTGAGVFLNWIAARRVSVFADNQLVRLRAEAFDRYDHLARAGVNVIHPRGVFVRITESYVTQRFTRTAVTDLPRSGFVLTDVEITYEFAGKRGLASLTLTNAFDRSFAAAIEGLSIDAFVPSRRALVSLRWRLW
jgi:tetratricopeptide (TPR) repeat protein